MHPAAEGPRGEPAVFGRTVIYRRSFSLTEAENCAIVRDTATGPLRRVAGLSSMKERARVKGAVTDHG
jgi:hypothetical protein